MIKILKLTTGEEVIADVENLSGEWALKNSIRLIISDQGVGMMPIAPFAKSDTVTLKDIHIMYQTDPDSELLNAYNSKYGSGIVIAGAGSSDLKIVT